MKKRLYQTPLLEEIPLGGLLEVPFCGVSGGEYSGTGPGTGDGYDPDSD